MPNTMARQRADKGTRGSKKGKNRLEMNQERALLAAPEERKQARRSPNSATQAQRQAHAGLSATAGKEMTKRRHRALLAHFAAPNSTEKGHVLPQIRRYEGSRRGLYEQKEAFPTLQTRNKRTKGAGYTGKRSLSLPLGYKDVKERKTGLEYRRERSLLSQLRV